MTLTLQAVPGAGYRALWGGACAVHPNYSSCELTITQATAATVMFVVPAVLRADVRGPGSITATDQSCTTNGCVWWSVYESQTLTVTAQPRRHARFVRWHGACTNRQRTCQLVVGKNTRVEAEFQAT